MSIEISISVYQLFFIYASSMKNVCALSLILSRKETTEDEIYMIDNLVDWEKSVTTSKNQKRFSNA